MVGDLYAKGGKLPPNFAEAAIWFRRAAEANHRGAARALGMLHLTGAGVGRDQEEAARWFRVAALAGDRNAVVDFGNLVLRGVGGEEDSLRTREWFEHAAASGDLVAAFNFGVCLAEGVGVERDDRKAAEWLRRAADGVVNAQYWYGRMLVDGRGVDADPEGTRLDPACRRCRHGGSRGHAGGNDAERPRRTEGSSGRSGLFREGGGARPCRRDVRRGGDEGRGSRGADRPVRRRSAGSARPRSAATLMRR